MLATLVCPAIAQTGPTTPPLLWQAKLPDRLVAASIATNAACVVARTKSRIHLIDRNGKQVWETSEIPTPQIEQYVLAVSPQCDWVAVYNPADTPEAHALQIFRRDGERRAVSLAAASNMNGPRINSLDISPDGKLLAVGFATNYLWIISRDGVVQTRVGPLQGAGVKARFAADGKHVVLTGWFNSGLMNLDGSWVWRFKSTNLAGSRKLDLFAALTAPMHGPQYGDITILDAAGKERWNRSGYDASMAIAPDGGFVAFVSKTQTANQPTQPPFPLVPELNDTPEIWVLDPNGKELAHGPFAGTLVDVSGDSSCILAFLNASTLAGFSRSLKEIWRIENLTRLVPYPEVTADLVLNLKGDSISAYRIPACGR